MDVSSGMSRPLLRFSSLSCFLLGVILPFKYGFPSDYLSFLSIASFVILSVAGGLLWRIHAPLIALMFGTLWSAYSLENRLDAQFPNGFEKYDLAVTATIESMPTKNNRSERFIATISPKSDVGLPPEVIAFFDHKFIPLISEGDDRAVGKKVRLSWYHAEEIYPGQSWDMTIRLRRPRGFVNPNGFDYQAWLLGEGILATGYVRDGKLIADKNYSFRQKVERYRFALKTQLFTNNAAENKGLIMALMLGDTSEIGSDDWDNLNATGTVHLMAISGLHIGLIAWLFYGIGVGVVRGLSMLWLRPLLLYFPNVISISAALFYSLLAGLSVPTQRAFIFVLVLNVFQILGNKVSPAWLLVLAASVICVLEPFSVVQQGFWLSFSAVAVLLYSFWGRVSLPVAPDEPRYKNSVELSSSGFFKRESLMIVFLNKAWRNLKLVSAAQLTLFVGLAIPIAVWTNTISLVSPIANGVAVPFASFLVVPWVIFSACVASISEEFALTLISISDFFLHYLIVFLKLVKGIFGSFSLVGFSASSGLIVIVGILSSILLLSPRYLYLTPLAVICGVSILFSGNDESVELKITFLDVGQGLAVVVQTEQEVLLYDTGAKFSENFDLGSAVVLPYLAAQGVSRLDRVIVSHSDNDHAGGIDSVDKGISVNSIITSDINHSVFDRLKQRRTIQECVAGESWMYGTVHFEFVWPRIDDEQRPEKPNNNSCVLKIVYKEQVILLTGDIEKKAEASLAEALKSQGSTKVHILSVAHHGSNTSSSDNFIDSVKPEQVVVSSGYKNRYGHPHAKVIQRLESGGAKVWNTAYAGAVTLAWNSRKEGFDIRAQRDEERKPWY